MGYVRVSIKHVSEEDGINDMVVRTQSTGGNVQDFAECIAEACNSCGMRTDLLLAMIIRAYQEQESPNRDAAWLALVEAASRYEEAWPDLHRKRFEG